MESFENTACIQILKYIEIDTYSTCIHSDIVDGRQNLRDNEDSKAIHMVLENLHVSDECSKQRAAEAK